MGFNLDALRAGYHPKKMPVAAEKPKATRMETGDTCTAHPWVAERKVEVPTLSGPKRVKVAEGTQPGATLRLQGLGAPGTGGHRGDLYARLMPVLPTHPDDTIRRLFRELAEARNQGDSVASKL